MPSQYQPKRAQNRPRRHNPLPLLAAAAAVCLGLILIPSLGRAPEEPTAAASPPAAATPTPTAAPTTMQLSYQNQTNHDLANRR